MPSSKRKVGSVRGKLNRDVFFDTDPNQPKILELNLSDLIPNPDQPRLNFDSSAIKELSLSIDRHGLIQPITVQDLDDVKKYMVVAGERRVRAHHLLGRETMFAIRSTGNSDEIALMKICSVKISIPSRKPRRFRG